MNTVYFKNDGLIDLTAVTTFGVNAKETDNPFGFFGTGLKYAIAILLRNNHEIVIYRGLEAHRFTVAEKIVRGQPFKIVCMDDRELGFTLDVGKTWKMWQVFRELYCNTMDENGAVSLTGEPEEDTTLVAVSGDAFLTEYVQRDKTVLNTKPIYQLGRVNVHPRSNDSVFYRTIRVAEFERPPQFTYNIVSKLALTEDRTVANSHELNSIIRECVLCGDNAKFIRDFISVNDGTYEATVDMNWNDTPSDTFMSVMKSISFKDVANPSLLAFYRKHTEKRKTPKPAIMTDVEKQQLSRAVRFCEKLNYEVSKHTINVTDDLKKNILGMVYNDEIYIARRTFMQGTKQVAATVLEEHLHLHKNFHDETYEFQTYLFDVIVSLGEQLNGEPL